VTDPHRTAKFIAVVSRESERRFRATFPDLPGRGVFAESFEEAASVAAETLALILEEADREGRPLPPPSTFTAVLSNPQYRDGIAIRVVAVSAAS